MTANVYVRSAIPPYPIACPDSASLRCLNALRYFVRSYVTRPTTIRAITETPANTPKPIGRTDSFFPGSVNAAAWEEEALAAAAEPDEEEVKGDAETAAAVAPGELLVELLEVLDVVLVADGVGDGVAAGTVDTPLTITAGLATELVVDVLLVVALLVGEVANVIVEDEVTLDEAEERGIVDPVLPPVLPPELLLPPEVLSNTKVHCFTSCTSGCPPDVMGVKVIVHVSVAGPIAVFICVTVVTVVGCEISWSRFGRTEVS